MNLDDIIPFLIFIGIIGFNIFKKIGKKKQEILAEEPVQKPAKKKAFGLSNLVDTIKAEIEKTSLAGQPKTGAQKDSIWTALAKEDASPRQEFDEGNQENLFQEDVPASVPAEEYNLKVELPPEPVKHIPIKPSVVGSCKRKRKASNVKYLCPSKMREAIVLSEILAKPIGLRD